MDPNGRKKGSRSESDKPKAERPLTDKVEDTIKAFLSFVRAYVYTIRSRFPQSLSLYDAGIHWNDKRLIRPLT